MIDLRSDTLTKPTEGMRAAIAAAEVGDDVYHEDPNVNALERRVADLLGKDDAVYMPSGTMSNQIAIRLHTEPGDVVVTERHAHVDRSEGGGPGSLSGVTIRHVGGQHGVFSAEALVAMLPPLESEFPSSWSQPYRLLCAECTHNAAGGTIWPIDRLDAVCGVASERGMATHLDGARLWNASAATGFAEAAYAAPFGTVNVCFSKGLGAPMGSALAGSTEHVARARRFKQMIGGGFRQAGMMAAGALYAVDHQRERLSEDHENARTFAEAAATMAGIDVDLDAVQTNIVYLESDDSSELVEGCRDGGVAMSETEAQRIRAVFHLDVSGADTRRAVDVLARVTAELG
jgi:threonine aldolase